MKRIIFTLIFFTAFFKMIAQEPSVENSIWGIQLGVYPISMYNELKITNSISLRSEIGFSYAWTSSNGINGSNQWAVTPDINIEPRYYYNLKRRNSLEKRIDNNSGNYLSLNLGYCAGNLAIKSKNTDVNSSIHIIPMYGLRRNIGKRFNSEFAIGIGYSRVFKEYHYVDYITQQPNSYKYSESGVTYGIRLAIGYCYLK